MIGEIGWRQHRDLLAANDEVKRNGRFRGDGGHGEKPTAGSLRTTLVVRRPNVCRLVVLVDRAVVMHMRFRAMHVLMRRSFILDETVNGILRVCERKRRVRRDYAKCVKRDEDRREPSAVCHQYFAHVRFTRPAANSPIIKIEQWRRPATEMQHSLKD
jgi:hypothetical protein